MHVVPYQFFSFTIKADKKKQPQWKKGTKGE